MRTLHACMIVNENIYVMLLVEKFFKSFSKKEICDTIKDTEVIIALSTESREKVDRMIQNVIKAGGRVKGITRPWSDVQMWISGH